MLKGGVELDVPENAVGIANVEELVAFKDSGNA